MNYPEHILPKVHFKIMHWHDDLLCCALVRKVNVPDFYDYQNNEIKVDHIKLQRDHLRDFSTSLLGIFKEEDFQFEIAKEVKDTYYKLWEEGKKVKRPKSKDFGIVKPVFYFYLAINGLHGKIVKYIYENKTEFEGKCIVKHTPTNANYWHFSVRWLNSEGEDLNDEESRHSKQLLSSAKNFIKVSGKPEKPEYSVLSEYHYCKGH